MRTEKTEAGSVFDQLAERFENEVNHLCHLSSTPELFAEFMQKAKPKEISLLMCVLDDYPRHTSLAECMKSYADSEEFKEKVDIARKCSGHLSESSKPRELEPGETPAIQYSLKARLETHFEEDLERIELTLEEYEAVKRTLAEMRDGHS